MIKMLAILIFVVIFLRDFNKLNLKPGVKYQVDMHGQTFEMNINVDDDDDYTAEENCVFNRGELLSTIVNNWYQDTRNDPRGWLALHPFLEDFQVNHEKLVISVYFGS